MLRPVSLALVGVATVVVVVAMHFFVARDIGVEGLLKAVGVGSLMLVAAVVAGYLDERKKPR
jgi:hypothetical protein